MSEGYLLDTDTLIFLLRRRYPSIVRRMQECAGMLHVSSVSLAELEYGAARSQDPVRHRVAVAELMSRLHLHAFDEVAARRAGAIRAELAGAGTPIGAYDVLLAGQAHAAGLTMVTHNVREFSRVRGLVVEDWVETDGQPDA